MAAVSAVTSDNNPWEFSVRLDSQEPGSYDTPTYLDASPRDIGSSRSMSSSNTSYRPLAVQDPNTMNGQQSQSTRGGRLSRKASDLGESDGSGEMPKAQSRTRSNTANDSRKMRKSSAQRTVMTRAEEEQYWIHRDKLAQIEQHELEVAGFRMSAAAGAINGMHPGHEAYENGQSEYGADPYAMDHEAGYRQRLGSAVHLDDDQADEMGWELRRPEEVAAENFYPYVSPPPRHNGSKLPIKKSGAFSGIPSDDRDVFPTPKSRNVSGAHTGIPEPRARSRSVASHAQSGSGTRPQTPTHMSSDATPSASDKSDSPPPAPLKIAGKTVATPRKPSNARVVSATKSRTTSTATKGDSPPKRPGTGSGLGGRPSTSQQRPEGEAPWIATMYKPDPRLPPDQQVLPTHARRLAQEQWEKEGKTGTIYDKDFKLLNTTTITNPYAGNGNASPTEQTSPVKDYLNLNFDSNNSPTKLTNLPSPKGSPHELPLGSPHSQGSGNRPGTSGTDHGGYKTMPKIHGPPTPRSSAPPKPAEPIRMQDFDDDAGMKDKGCCCIIM